MKKSKPLLALLWLLISLILPSCGPYLTYDELTEARSVEEDPKKAKKLDKKIDRFETDADEANAFFALRETCGDGGDKFWYCLDAWHSDARVDRLLRKDLTLDQRVRLYRMLKPSCSCAPIRNFEELFH